MTDIDAKPDSSAPTHHASLSDGIKKLGIIFCDQKGNKNSRYMRVQPFPRTALKTTSGQSQYSSLSEPYTSIAQDNWLGGGMNLDFEKDKTRYFESRGVQIMESGLMNGPELLWGTGIRNIVMEWPTSSAWTYRRRELRGNTLYWADSFVAPSSGSNFSVDIEVRRIGTPGAGLVFSIYTDSSGSPGSSIGTVTLAVSDVSNDGVFHLTKITIVPSPALVSGTTYWLVIQGPGTTNSAGDHWEVIANNQSATGGKTSANGSTWAANYGLTFRLYYDADVKYWYKFFEYKNAFYIATKGSNSTGNSVIYINGDRGAADDNSGDLSKLNDATKAWTTNQWVGAYVLIIAGSGTEETIPWRKITANTATALTVSPNWIITQDTTSEYVIKGTPVFQAWQTLTGIDRIDVEPAGDYAYFTRGEAGNVVRYQEYNDAGTWTKRYTTESFKATQLRAIHHPTYGNCLWFARNRHPLYGNAVGFGQIPVSYGNLYSDLGELVGTNKPWDGRDITNVTQSTTEGHTKIAVAAGFTTGNVAVENLPEAIDITAGKKLGVLIKSSVAAAANDLSLILDDVEDLAELFLPSKVFINNDRDSTEYTVAMSVKHRTADAAYTTLTAAYDGNTATNAAVTLTTAQDIYIGAPYRFNNITVDMGTTVNAVAATLSAYTTSPAGSTTVTITSDGTASGGATLAQDGVIAFTAPGNWVQRTIDGITAYWIRLVPSANLTASINIIDISISYETETLKYDRENIYDAVGFNDVSTRIRLSSDDELLICGNQPFNKITVNMGTTVNAVAATLAGTIWDGNTWTSVTLTDGTASGGATLAQDGDITFTIPYSWKARTLESTNGYWLKLVPSANLTNDIQIFSIKLTRQNNITVNLPALTANQEAWATVDIDPNAWPLADETRIKSIGLKLNTDLGAQNIELRGGVRVLGPDVTWYELPIESRITNIEGYASSENESLQNPWIFTESRIFEVQQQVGNQIVGLPLREIHNFRSFENGMATCVNGVYLYFNLGKRIQRYYNRTMEDISPDRADATRYRRTFNETPGSGGMSITPLGAPGFIGPPQKVTSGGGLKESLLGQPVKMLSYPGRVFVAYNAGKANDSLYSSIYAYDGGSWHEIYTSDIDELQIRDIYYQALPWQTTGYLWISHGDDIAYLTISDNPRNDSKYIARHEGVLVSSWIHSNMYDVKKLWRSLKSFAENVGKGAAAGNVFIDYQLDYENEETDYSTVGEGTWTEIGQYFTLPSHERDILASNSDTAPRGHRLRYRARMYAPSAKLTPLVKAIVLEAIAFVPVKYSISFSFLLQEGMLDTDLEGNLDSTWPDVASKISKLMEWANSGVELKWVCNFEPFSGWRTFIDPATYTPLSSITDEGIESHIGQMTLIQI